MTRASDSLGSKKNTISQVIKPNFSVLSTSGSDPVHSQELARVAMSSRKDSGAGNLELEPAGTQVGGAHNTKKNRKKTAEDQQKASGMEMGKSNGFVFLQVPTTARSRNSSVLSVGSGIDNISDVSVHHPEYHEELWQQLWALKVAEDQRLGLIIAMLNKMSAACEEQKKVINETKEWIFILQQWTQKLVSSREKSKRRFDELHEVTVIGTKDRENRYGRKERTSCMIDCSAQRSGLHTNKPRLDRSVTAVRDPLRRRNGPAFIPTVSTDSPAKENEKKKKKEKRKSQKEKKKKIGKQKKEKPKADPAALRVLVKLSKGQTYASVLGRIREDKNLVADDATLIGTSKTESGDLLIRLR